MRLIIVLLALLIAASAPAPALATAAKEKFKPGATIEGHAVALDGDTIRLFRADGGKPIDVRIWGIDAPEMSAENGQGWASRAVLDDFLAGVTGDQVLCTVIDTDRYKRPVGTCHPSAADGLDLGHWMIVNGWAVEYRKYTRPAPPAVEPGLADRYAKAETSARKNKSGRWALIYGG